MNTMLNPKGRIGPATFRNAALILIVIGAILSLAPLLNPMLALLGILGLVLIWPWVVIWVKRLHDAGKSGWWFLAVLVLWLIVSVAVSLILTAQFAPASPDLAGSTDFAAIMAAMTEQMSATVVPSTIASVVISLIFVLGANAVLKSDPGPNAYGPPPVQ
jgi:uncharacterized membrane protein YhaH (DUF805 family)